MWKTHDGTLADADVHCKVVPADKCVNADAAQGNSTTVVIGPKANAMGKLSTADSHCFAAAGVSPLGAACIDISNGAKTLFTPYTGNAR